MGLEPTRLYKHKILSLACLPIPALPPITTSDLTIISKATSNVNEFCKKILQFIASEFIDNGRLYGARFTYINQLFNQYIFFLVLLLLMLNAVEHIYTVLAIILSMIQSFIRIINDIDKAAAL